MKLSKFLLAGVVGLTLVGGTTTVSNASTVNYRGIPKVLRGNWKSKFHKMDKKWRTSVDYYHKDQLIIHKTYFRAYGFNYNKKHKMVVNSPDEGLNKNLTYQHTKKHQYYVTGRSWKDLGTYDDYEFDLSHHNKKIVVWTGESTSDSVYYYNTFYKR